MDLPEYLRLVSNKMETSDRDEQIRLIKLLIDVLNETLEKVNKSK